MPTRDFDQLTVEALDRANTAPLCPDCEYRMLALAAGSYACRHCGQTYPQHSPIVRLLLSVFRGRIVNPGDDDDDRP